MYLKKIITSMLLAMVLLMSICLPAMATNTGKTTTNTGTVTTNTGTVISVPVITGEEKVKTVTELGDSIITAYFFRSGDTTQCQLYLNWTGDLNIEGFRYKSIFVQNTNWLNRITYAEFGDGYNYSYAWPEEGGGTTGSVFIGTVYVPTDQTQVYITQSDLQVYVYEAGSWLSGYLGTGNVYIN